MSDIKIHIVASNNADAKKAKILLGWETEKSLKQMCTDAWLWTNRLADASP